MQNRMKLVVAGLASALAVAVVALGVVTVALRPEADASPQSPAAGAAPVQEAVDAPGAQGQAPAPVVVVAPSGGGTTVTTTAPPTTTPPTTTPPTTQPPGGGGGGTRPPRPPLDDILGDPPLVLDPGPSGPSTTTPTLPPQPCNLPFRLCP